MTSLDPLERAVSALERDPNLPRVKKLLYCACYGVWEDSPERLNQVSLQEIVQGVWERSPTLEALQFQLNRVVKTLNKPVAYAHVANSVLRVLNELYFDTYDITQPVMVNRVQLSMPPGAGGEGHGTGYPAAESYGNFGAVPPAHHPGGQNAFPQGQGPAHGSVQNGYEGYGPEGYGPEGYGSEGYGAGHPSVGGHAASSSSAYGAPNGHVPHRDNSGSHNSGNHNSGSHNSGSHNASRYDATPAHQPSYGTVQSDRAQPGPLQPGHVPRQDYGARPGAYGSEGYASSGYGASSWPTEGAQEATTSGESPTTEWFVAGQSSQNSLSPAQLSAQTAVRAHVIQNLSNHREQQRMKKLLICVCHNKWENSQAQLAAWDWEQLLDDVRHLMPTLHGLNHVLQAISNSLSKPMEYLRVAELLLDMVTPLYEQDRPDETQFFGVTPEVAGEPGLPSNQPHSGQFNLGQSHARGPADPSQTAGAGQDGVAPAGIYRRQPARRNSDALAPTAFDVNDEPPTGVFAPQLPSSPMDRKYPPRALPENEPQTVPLQALPSHVESTVAITQVVSGNEAIVHSPEVNDPTYKDAQDWTGGTASQSADSRFSDENLESDEFTLRLTLMRYANPLMAKVVVFSALNRLFRFSEQDWSDLRHYSLATLLEELEQRYPNLIDLEMKLCAVAEQLEAPEQAMQTVAALLKVLKPRYTRATQSPGRDMGWAVDEPLSSDFAAQDNVASSANSSLSINPAGASSISSHDLELKGLEGSIQSEEPSGSVSNERATAIQFGPEAGEAAPPVASEISSSDVLAADSDSFTQETPSAIPTLTAQPVKTELLPSDEATNSALLSDDLEADLALLAASIEDDAPSLPLE